MIIRIIHFFKTATSLFFMLGSTFLFANDSEFTPLYQSAEASYIYMYPLVLMDISKAVMTNVSHAGTERRAPINQFSHAAEFPTPAYRDFVRPNADTLYSFAWLDLSIEPIILSVPNTENRYYLMPMLDAWTDIFASPGKRTTGTHASHFVILGPDWTGDVPSECEIIHSPSNTVWIMGRTLTRGESDYGSVHDIQQHYKLTPLSQWGKNYVPPTNVVIDPNLDMSEPSLQVTNMNAEQFFKRASHILKSNPPHDNDTDILKELAFIGLVPGRDFDISKFTEKEIKVLNSAVKTALQKIKLHYTHTANNENGWLISKVTGQYGTDYLTRASTAYGGLGANLPEDAVYFIAFHDAKKTILHGKNNYVLHIPHNELPPVNGLWSITLYGSGGYFESNSMNRYAIGDRDNLVFNPDGSLDIYVQHASPGIENESNWLPTPKSNFNLAMRLYWPITEIMDDENRWLPPTIIKK